MWMQWFQVNLAWPSRMIFSMWPTILVRAVVHPIYQMPIRLASVWAHNVASSMWCHKSRLTYNNSHKASTSYEIRTMLQLMRCHLIVWSANMRRARPSNCGTPANHSWIYITVCHSRRWINDLFLWIVHKCAGDTILPTDSLWSKRENTKFYSNDIQYVLRTLQREYCGVIIGIQTIPANKYHATVTKMSAIKTDFVDEHKSKSFTTMTDYLHWACAYRSLSAANR